VAQAIKKFEEKNGVNATQAEEVLLYGQIPPIQKIDSSLNTLVNCKKLSLSSNSIDKIPNLASLQKLEILSLGRNTIKSLLPLDAVANTLQQLWISYNQIEKLVGINLLKKLRVLYMSNNRVKEWAELERLTELPELEDLHFVANPLEDKMSKEGTWRNAVAKLLPKLKKLDGTLVGDPADLVLLAATTPTASGTPTPGTPSTTANPTPRTPSARS